MRYSGFCSDEAGEYEEGLLGDASAEKYDLPFPRFYPHDTLGA